MLTREDFRTFFTSTTAMGSRPRFLTSLTLALITVDRVINRHTAYWSWLRIESPLRASFNIIIQISQQRENRNTLTVRSNYLHLHSVMWPTLSSKRSVAKAKARRAVMLPLYSPAAPGRIVSFTIIILIMSNFHNQMFFSWCAVDLSTPHISRNPSVQPWVSRWGKNLYCMYDFWCLWSVAPILQAAARTTWKVLDLIWFWHGVVERTGGMTWHKEYTVFCLQHIKAEPYKPWFSEGNTGVVRLNLDSFNICTNWLEHLSQAARWV